LRPGTDPFFVSIPKIQTYEKELLEAVNKSLISLSEEIKSKGVGKVKSISLTGSVHEEIIQLSKRIKTDIIIMGTHGVSGFREFVMGSNTFRVVNEALCPVLSVQQKMKATDFKNILLPFRGKPHSREKVDYVIKIAEIFGSTIHVLGVDTDESKSDLNKIELEAEQIKQIVQQHGLKCKIKVESSAYLSDKVLKYSKEVKADLIVIMSDLDKMRISEYIMGPFSQQIVNHSLIPVLSIRPTFNPYTVNLHGYGW
jgi:nucleotide-binding universal stress UspA family protein